MKAYMIPEFSMICMEENDVIRTSLLNGVEDSAGIGGDMDFNDFFA